MTPPQPRLPNPPLYTPYRNGRFKTTPDFHPLGTDLGAGPLDHELVQWDCATDAILAEKAAVRRRRQVWFPTPGLDDTSADAVANVLEAHRAKVAPPNLPALALPDDPRERLRCLGESIPEDFAVTIRDPAGHDRICALHVSLPSRWDPAEKQDLNFAATHAPVPGMQKVSAVAGSLMDSVRRKGPQVRFTWGIAFTPDYDQHPERPSSSFDGHHFWVRIERQVLWPVDGTDAFLFTIRLHVHPGTAIITDPDAARGLATALRNMTPDERRYKGLLDDADRVASWLDEKLPAR